MKEHIKALTRIKENYERLWQENLAKEEDVKEEYDAVCAGINALEAEPCEDCISRDFIRSLGAKCIAKRGEDGVLYAIVAIDHIPSVTPARKKGKWITIDGVHGVAYCSECDYELRINDTNYCPNCGAKMEVDK